MSTAASELLPALLAFEELRTVGADTDEADAAMGQHEGRLSAGAIATADDLYAKARYLQICGRIDPSLVPRQALDTLVVGVVRVLGHQLSPGARVAAAAA